MRLWTLHPKYLDVRGLAALWREGLLAQAVLRGRTKGYVHHPQLVRFRSRPSPVGAMADYLRAVQAEAVSRGYRFNTRKISRARDSGSIEVTHGQLQYEWNHLTAKLETRDTKWRARLENVRRPQPHPLFRIVPGSIEAWEKRATADHKRKKNGTDLIFLPEERIEPRWRENKPVSFSRAFSPL